MTDILLVAATEEAEAEAAVAATLERRGYRVVRGAGAEAALTSSAAVVVLWTDSAFGAHALVDFAAQAAQSRKAVIAKLTRRATPMSLRAVPTADLSMWTGEADDPFVQPLLALVEAAAGPPGAAAPAAPAPSAEESLAQDAAFWREIKDKRDPLLFLDYLEKFGRNGAFADVALMRLRQIEGGAEPRLARMRPAGPADAAAAAGPNAATPLGQPPKREEPPAQAPAARAPERAKAEPAPVEPVKTPPPAAAPPPAAKPTAPRAAAPLTPPETPAEPPRAAPPAAAPPAAAPPPPLPQHGSPAWSGWSVQAKPALNTPPALAVPAQRQPAATAPVPRPAPPPPPAPPAARSAPPPRPPAAPASAPLTPPAQPPAARTPPLTPPRAPAERQDTPFAAPPREAPPRDASPREAPAARTPARPGSWEEPLAPVPPAWADDPLDDDDDIPPRYGAGLRGPRVRPVDLKTEDLPPRRGPRTAVLAVLAVVLGVGGFLAADRMGLWPSGGPAVSLEAAEAEASSLDPDPISGRDTLERAGPVEGTAATPGASLEDLAVAPPEAAAAPTPRSEPRAADFDQGAEPRGARPPAGSPIAVATVDPATSLAPMPDGSSPLAANQGGAPSILAPEPVWRRRPSVQDLARVYPERAARVGQGGRVMLRCTVRATLRAACLIVSEDPIGQGFGQAALRAAETLQAEPVLADGSSAVGAAGEVAFVFRPQ